MTPEEIAAKLTPAQVRALRDPDGCSDDDWRAFLGVIPKLRVWAGFWMITDLGRAVLAALDAKGEPK